MLLAILVITTWLGDTAKNTTVPYASVQECVKAASEYAKEPFITVVCISVRK